MRVLGLGVKNRLKIKDNISGSTLSLYFRDPTTQERINYANELMQVKGRKIKLQQTPTRIKFGLKILLGFDPGDFGLQTGMMIKPIASDQGHPDYHPDWKTLVLNQASDLIDRLGGHVFDESADIVPGESAEDKDNQDEPEAFGSEGMAAMIAEANVADGGAGEPEANIAQD